MVLYPTLLDRLSYMVHRSTLVLNGYKHIIHLFILALHIQVDHGLACMVCCAQCFLYNNRECSPTGGNGYMLS